MRYYLLLTFFYFNLFATSYETIHNSGSSDNRIDLVFIGDRYFADEMEKYESDVSGIWGGLKSHYAIWNRYSNFFNVHRIDLISKLNNPEDINDISNSAFGLDFNLGWGGSLDWKRCLSITDELKLGNEVSCILTNRVFGLGKALHRDITGLIYAAPWTSIVSHEIGHILGMAVDEYKTTMQEGHYYYGFNIARSPEDARQRWGHWIGYKDPFTGYEIAEPYKKEGTNFYRPTKSNGLMNESAFGDFHAVNREQMILQIYRYVNPVDSHTETNSSVNQNHILEINVVDPDVISVAWVINDQIVSNQSSLELSLLNLSEGTIIYGCAWDNCLNLDYQTNDRGGWIRKDEARSSFKTISWKFSSLKENHDQLGNKDYLELMLSSSKESVFFNQEQVSTLTLDPLSQAGQNGNSQINSRKEEKAAHNGWQESWFGIYLEFKNKWVYHINHKWLYVSDDGEGGVWAWFSEEGWMWTNNKTYPYFHKHRTKEWLYLN